MSKRAIFSFIILGAIGVYSPIASAQLEDIYADYDISNNLNPANPSSIYKRLDPTVEVRRPLAPKEDDNISSTAQGPPRPFRLQIQEREELIFAMTTTLKPNLSDIAGEEEYRYVLEYRDNYGYWYKLRTTPARSADFFVNRRLIYRIDARTLNAINRKLEGDAGRFRLFSFRVRLESVDLIINNDFSQVEIPIRAFVRGRTFPLTRYGSDFDRNQSSRGKVQVWLNKPN